MDLSIDTEQDRRLDLEGVLELRKVFHLLSPPMSHDLSVSALADALINCGVDVTIFRAALVAPVHERDVRHFGTSAMFHVSAFTTTGIPDLVDVLKLTD